MLRVKNIHYIMASLESAGHSNLRIGEPKLPRGLNVQLKISLHDNMGNEILHSWDANEHLGYAVSRRDGLTVHVDADFKLTVSKGRDVVMGELEDRGGGREVFKNNFSFIYLSLLDRKLRTNFYSLPLN